MHTISVTRRVTHAVTPLQLPFSFLICALNLYFSQNLLRTQNLLEVARTAKNCSKRQKLLKSCRAQSGKAYQGRETS